MLCYIILCIGPQVAEVARGVLHPQRDGAAARLDPQGQIVDCGLFVILCVYVYIYIYIYIYTHTYTCYA